VQSIDLQRISELLAGSLFLLAAVSKVLNFRWFNQTWAKYGLSLGGANWRLGLGLICTESVIGAALLLGKLRPLSSYFAFGLLVIFTAAITRSLVQGHYKVDCGCIGFWRKTESVWKLILRNVGLLGIVGLSLRRLGNVIVPSSIGWIVLVVSTGLLVYAMFPTLGCRPSSGTMRVES